MGVRLDDYEMSDRPDKKDNEPFLVFSMTEAICLSLLFFLLVILSALFAYNIGWHRGWAQGIDIIC